MSRTVNGRDRRRHRRIDAWLSKIKSLFKAATPLIQALTLLVKALVAFVRAWKGGGSA